MPTTNTTIRCALYDRVSTELQAVAGLSLEAQQKALIDYAHAHNYEIVGIYTDEGLTARKKLQNRKELLRLLDDVKQDKIDLILVTKLDRWFRNIKDYHNTQEILEAHNCNWKTIYEEYDTTTANGRFAINIMLSVNENECDRDSDRIKEVFRLKIARNEWLNGKNPCGYIQNAEHRLIKDPAKMELVQDMFDTYFTNFSKTRTITYIRDKYPDAPSGSNMSKMFQHEIYTGIRNGIQICEGYITKEQFDLIQKTSGLRRRNIENRTYLFSKLIRCPHCNQCLTAFHKKNVKKSGNTYYYKSYRCSNKWTDHPKPSVSESVVERYLLDNIEQELDRQITFAQKNRPVKNNAAKIQRLKKELNNLNILFQKGRIELDYYDREYSRIEAEINELNVIYIDFEKASKTFSGDWKALYGTLDDEGKKAFWLSCIDAILMDKSHKLAEIKFL